MDINVHMIVTKTFFKCKPSETVHAKKQIDGWLKEVEGLESNLDKIGTFIYSNGEAVDEEYKSVRFIVEIKNDEQQ